MKILHISDLHYQAETADEISEFAETVIKKHKNEGIEFIFFTGDLVQSGDNEDNFKQGLKFLHYIADGINVEYKNIIFCAGNHDIYRGQELPIITNEIAKFTTNDQLDSFVNDKRQFEGSLENTNNFNNLLLKHIEDAKISTIEYHQLFQIYEVETKSLKKINIVVINSAWRSKDNKDEGNLLFPNVFLEQIKKTLKGNKNQSILMMHHPISDFKYYNRTILETFILNNFIVVFSGHVHKKHYQKLFNNQKGVVELTAEACNCNISRNEAIGFSIIDIDLDHAQVNINPNRIDYDGNLYEIDSYKVNIPVGEDRAEKIKFTLLLNDKFEQKNFEFKNLFVSFTDDDNFFKLFRSPLLKDTPSVSLKGLAKTTNTSKNIALENIVSEHKDFILFGRDKYGKTITLTNIYLSYLREFQKHQTIPLFIDAEFWNKHKSIENNIINEYQIKKSSLESLTEKYRFIILVDNIDREKTGLLEKELKLFIDKKKNINVIYSINESLLDKLDIEYNYPSKTEKLNPIYIHSLTNKELRILTNDVECEVNIKADIIRNINSVFKQLNLPVNYWTVSLFLWIYKNSNIQHFESNFELIDLYIDSLLDKEAIVTNRNIKMSYESLKEFLGALAYTLVDNYRESTYSIDYSELISFMDVYKQENRRFVVELEVLASLLIEKDILVKNESDRYCFRLKGIFEYFIAYHLKDQSKLRNNIINNDSIYLSFGNELELLAGFNKKDSDYTNQIFNKTLDFYKDSINRYNQNKDSILEEKSKNIFTELKNINNYNKSEGHSNIMMDIDTDSDYSVSKKKIQTNLDKTASNHEHFLFIFTRVFRNSDIKDKELNDKYLNFILDATCNLSFMIVDESLDNKNLPKDFLKLIMQFTPFVAQAFLSEALTQSNLETLILDKINELKKESKNEFKLYLLYNLLIDIDVKTNKKFIPEMIKKLKSPIMKFAIQSKLIYLLLFQHYMTDNTRTYIEDELFALCKTHLNLKDKDINKLRVEINLAKLTNTMKGQGKFL